ncbi:MAG: hypothetical protein ACREFX_10275 [Opitutaceae bacterium]
MAQAAFLAREDLLALERLDLKLWVALSCPVRGLELDARTLALVDGDGDGRIRASEVIAAANWAAARLKDPGDLLRPADALPIDSIESGTPEGAAIADAARRVLQDVGERQATAIGLGALGAPEKLFPAGRINGDGVVPPGAAEDDPTRKLIADIVSSSGAAKGPTGTEGVTRDQAEKFFAEIEAYCSWADTATPAATATLGDQTETAYSAVSALRAKADDYFTRCRVAAFDTRAQDALNRAVEDFAPLAAKSLEPSTPELAAFPLAHIAPDRALPLGAGVNPAWADAVERLRADAVAPVFGTGKSDLTGTEWKKLQAVFAPYEDWLRQRPAGKAQAVGLARAKEILAGSGRAGLMALLDRDAELAPAYGAFADLERLIRYRRDLFTVLHNFVSFADFYSPDRRAIFQAGVLYLDNRSCDLCVRADDPAAHATMAALSLACIAYVECKRPGEAPIHIAACFTQGDSDYLYLGRNGVFYDRSGRDWDATIVRFLNNPISIRQAFLSPYKKFVRFVQEQVTKRAAAVQASPASALGSLTSPAGGHKFDVGTIAALGVAVGGLSSAIGIALGAFFGLKAWMPVGLIGILVVISGPSVLIAWLKLRQRTLGPILEASGWAINGRVRITMPLGRALTQRARLPPGTRRRFEDPYRENRYGWLWWGLLALAALVAGALCGAHLHHLWPFAPWPFHGHGLIHGHLPAMK